MPLQNCITKESSTKLVTTTNCKVVTENASRVDRFARGSTISRGSNIPISIKFKKLTNEDAVRRQREQHRTDIRQHELGKSRRKPPPIEIGPKRLKVTGPSFLASENRLN